MKRMYKVLGNIVWFIKLVFVVIAICIVSVWDHIRGVDHSEY